MLITQEVEIGLVNIKYYEDLGYKIPRRKDKHGRISVPKGSKIKVKIKDLTPCAHALIEVVCDNCGKDIKNVQWENYLGHLHEDKYYCHECSMLLFGQAKTLKTKMLNSKSFEQWCIDNLSEDETKNILDRWDYDKNKCSPKEIMFGSKGINKKGYWFKCQINLNHKSELQNIAGFTHGQKGSFNCIQCNSIFETHPELIKYFVNIEDTKKYSFGAHSIVKMKCPNCGFIKDTSINKFTTQGFSCKQCGDGISYPEKFMHNVLDQLGIDFQTQLSKTTFKWCKDYKYDFYIPSSNTIIETHGKQHYEQSGKNWSPFEETRQNDELKMQLAIANGIDKYIIIDCRKSELKFIKRNILSSIINELFDITNTDWIKCNDYACSSLIKTICDLWNNDNRDIQKIADDLKINRATVNRYLKQGNELNWCKYNSEEIRVKNLISMAKNNCIKVICITTGEIFSSAKEGAKKYNIYNSISGCCKGKKKHSGIYKGQFLEWMYYENYIKIGQLSKSIAS